MACLGPGVGAGLPALCSHRTGLPANVIELSRHSGREYRNPMVGWVEGRDPANQVTRRSWVSFLNPAYDYGLFLDSL